MKFQPLVFYRMKILVTSRELKTAALTAGFGVFFSLLLAALRFWGQDCASLPNAAIGWVHNYESMKTYFWCFVVAFLLPIVSAMLCADVIYRDKKYKRTNVIISRLGQRNYIVSSASLAFLVPFLFVFFGASIFSDSRLYAFSSGSRREWIPD